VLTFEEAYQETGVSVTFNANSNVIDDSAVGFASWSVAELHDAMETHYSRYPGGWPAWRMWGLLAGTFDDPLTAGIMFDAAATFGGSGEPPDRQGFAVFSNHSWFNDLVVAPNTQAEAAAMRTFLYTWVHEAGHAFNLLHSWNKGRADSLSWMNYPQRYDNLMGAVGAFWRNFRMRFDDQEVAHIRHGDRASVIMGGDPWASGGHLESPMPAASQSSEAPVELLVRSKGYFELAEPVLVELRLRNILENQEVDVDPRLNPEYGTTLIQVRRPDATRFDYQPVMCRLSEPETITLAGAQDAAGRDRRSELVFLSYGSDGFYFDRPGEYLIRALYQGLGDLVVVSNVHRIRIGSASDPEQDRLAHDFYSHQVGLSLYLRGSQSPFLAEGMELLETIATDDQRPPASASVATLVAGAIARPFYRQTDEEPILLETYEGDPERAVEVTASAAQYLHEEGNKPLNLLYSQLVEVRSTALVAAGQTDDARAEVGQLRDDLEQRDVKPAVLASIEDYAASLE
jgi:hypothetical protein